MQRKGADLKSGEATVELKLLLLTLTIALGTGCTTGYWVDRGRDAADVFTLSVGRPLFGVKAKVGPLAMGVPVFGALGDIPKTSEKIFPSGSEEFGLHSGNVDVFSPKDTWLLFWGEEEFLGWHDGDRNKQYSRPLGVPLLQSDTWRKKHAAQLTQIEVAAGFWFYFRVGFNPGELFDFLLGFVGIDIYSDDIERRNRESEQTGPPDGTK